MLTQDILKDSVWHSKQHRVDELTASIQQYKEKAKPFRWTYGNLA